MHRQVRVGSQAVLESAEDVGLLDITSVILLFNNLIDAGLPTVLNNLLCSAVKEAVLY